MAVAPVRRTASRLILAGALLLAAGCSPAGGGEQVVFAVATGFGQGARQVRTVDIIDVGVPELDNLTGSSVRVRAVSLAGVSPAVRLLGVTAHPDQTVGILSGNLNTRCKNTYPPYPVTGVVVPPHAASRWYLILALKFTRPGTYYLGHVKIYYTTGGQPGWQYQNLFTTIYVITTRPGTKPQFAGCP